MVSRSVGRGYTRDEGGLSMALGKLLICGVFTESSRTGSVLVGTCAVGLDRDDVLYSFTIPVNNDSNAPDNTSDKSGRSGRRFIDASIYNQYKGI